MTLKHILVKFAPCASLYNVLDNTYSISYYNNSSLHNGFYFKQ